MSVGLPLRLALPLLLLVASATPRVHAALAPGWTERDIGAPALLGSADYSNGTWTVSGGGTDICAYDQLHFAWKPIGGDAVISAEVISVQNAPSAQAGVMFRNDTTAGGIEAAVLATAASGVTFQWRASPASGCSYQIVIGVPGLGAPVWVRLARSGNNFSGYWSTNNTDWYQVGSAQTVPIGPVALAGLAVSANNNSALAIVTFSDVILPPPVFGLYRELWTGLNPGAGNSLAALTNSSLNPNWPDNPDPNFSDILTDFETQTNTGMTYYGQRLRAFVVPPTNGVYTLAIASDDTSELLLSPDEEPARATPIAWVATSTNPRQWTKETNQQSAPITLQAGRRYYLEALMQQGTGPDNLAVRWQLPNGTFEEPLSAMSAAGTRLVPYRGIDTPPGINVQPTDLTVWDGRDAVFSLLVTNQSAIAYQWRANSTNLPGPNAATSVYTVASANPALQNNLSYTCVISNSIGVVTSAPAVLTVVADTVRPTVAQATYLGETNVQLVFSEPVEVASATNPANYVFTNGVAVTSASLEADDCTVTLSTAPLVLGSNYVLVINGIRDWASTPNTIATNTVVPLFAGFYAPQGIGNPAPPGTLLGLPDGYDIGGGGRDIGGTSDQFQYTYVQRTGDFDVKVRLAALSLADAWSEAGTVAREDLTPGARSASVLATPSINGCYFQSRSATNGATTLSGSSPANYPNQWLRLKRAGSTFTGYAGFDGQNWAQLGTAAIAMPSTIYFGFAVSSHNTNQLATAAFRDFGDVTGAGASAALPFEPLGPCGRRTGLVISEIMYHPTNALLKFIEIFNSRGEPQDISGCKIKGSPDYVFPSGTVVQGGGFVVVARSPADLQSAYGLAGVLGPYAGSLPGDKGTVRLLNRNGAELLRVEYSNQPPWPVAADGGGHSLVLARPSLGERHPLAWAASDAIGGSPGRLDSFTPDPLRHVCINEFLAHTDPPLEDALELCNHSNEPKDLSGAWLSDDVRTNKFRIPDGTVLPPCGFMVFTASTIGFNLDKLGQDLALVNSNRTRVIDAVRYGPQENGVSMGRVPDGAPCFYRLASRTLGTNNGPPRLSSVVINEIMYDPISGSDDNQYVELYNRTANPVDLSNWRFTSGIDFIFPTNTPLAPYSCLVVAKNAARLQASYTNLNSGNCLGNFQGALAHGGERVALGFPDYNLVTNGSVVSVQTAWVDVNEVTYDTGGRWGQWAHGGGSSLELVDPDADNRLAQNWADSDETLKSPWLTIDHKELLDHVFPLGGAGAALNEVQVMLLGAGEALIDDLEVHSETPTTGPNLVANGTFSSGLTGWLIQGNHVRSSLEPAGPNTPSAALRLRASAAGDNGANRVETDLTATLSPNTTASLRARARWLRGCPELFFRLHGGGLEKAVTLPTPPNPGTPGLPNSRRVANAGPAIYDISHSPALPAANQPIVVTARVRDTDEVSAVQLQYRLDPSATVNTIGMRDDGLGGDAVANDGIFTASIGGFAASTVVAFRIQATDARAPTPATTCFPPDAPLRECVVRVGDPVYSGSLGAYHLWLTAAKTAVFSTREGLSNEPVDGTFVYNDCRVIYNADIRFRGSPFIRPGWNNLTGGAYAYMWGLPDDDPFLGVTELNTDSGEHGGRDSTVLREPTAFAMAEELGLPGSYERFIHIIINGVTESRRGFPIMLDVQEANSDYVGCWFPDDLDGDIYKIDDWFELTDTPTMQGNKSASLQNFTTTGGVKKQARYRWSWEKKSNRGYNDDYSSLFDAVDACNAPDADYVNHMEQSFEIEEWVGEMAFRHVVGDWDGYGYSRGKNQFTYRPRGGKFWMLPWDLDFSLGCNGGDGPQQELFTLALGGDAGSDNMPEVNRMYNHPHFRRIYLRTLQRLVNGPLQDTNFTPVLQAHYRDLQANGVASVSPFVGSGGQGLSIPAWIQQRRAYILGQLPAATFGLTATNLTVSTNLALISGTAPLNIESIEFNGVAWPITWTSVTAWTARVPVTPGTNLLVVLGRDLSGAAVPGASNQVSAVFNPSVSPPSPEGLIAINEIMFNPAVPDAQYLELFNTSSNCSFDLSGWELNGIGYAFPDGSLIAPRSFVVLAKDRVAFSTGYGLAVPVFDTYSGNLSADGETLTLVRHGTNTAGDLVAAKVRYDAAAPWPTNASATGRSLQLLDPLQDNWRAGNWATASSNSPPALQWMYATASGTASSSTFYIYLQSAGDVYIDDLKLVAGTVPEAGANVLADGNFESGFPGPWTVSPNHANSALSTAILRSGTASLHVVATSGGTTQGSSIWQTISPALASGQPYTLSFWYLQSTNGGPLVLRLSGSGVVASVNPAPPPGPSFALCTPGAANSVATTLAPFPPLWLNELQADNLTGITNRAGQRVLWLELYNPTTNAVSLAGLFLATNYYNLTAWAFPTGAVISPRQFKVVFADGQTNLSSTNELHTSFTLSSRAGALALSRLYNGQPQVLDYINYANLPANHSYGSFPDGQASARQDFYYATPGGTNNGASAPLTIAINEWMADNVATLADSADGDFEDWFELYNPGTNSVDLGGYYLTDALTNKFQFEIPNNGHYVIPPRGFLLVWADSETKQNSTNRADLHVNFKLDKEGEAIGLFGADGSPVDFVTFGPQLTDLSMGRYPDGGPNIYLLPRATPRTNNPPPNTAPTLVPIGDHVLTLGQSLTFTASATDTDSPPQTLTFSLGPGAPYGAAIDPATGQFSWTPATAPGSRPIALTVSDNGIPSLSATQTFTVTVVLPPAFQDLSLTGSQLAFSWPSLAGQLYQLEFKGDLTEPLWTPLGAPVLGTGALLTMTQDVTAAPQRFYRIRLVP
jgi:hypothetical protein